MNGGAAIRAFAIKTRRGGSMSGGNVLALTEMKCDTSELDRVRSELNRLRAENESLKGENKRLRNNSIVIVSDSVDTDDSSDLDDIRRLLLKIGKKVLPKKELSKIRASRSVDTIIEGTVSVYLGWVKNLSKVKDINNLFLLSLPRIFQATLLKHVDKSQNLGKLLNMKKSQVRKKLSAIIKKKKSPIIGGIAIRKIKKKTKKVVKKPEKKSDKKSVEKSNKKSVEKSNKKSVEESNKKSVEKVIDKPEKKSDKKQSSDVTTESKYTEEWINAL